jgi:hypothetical protein
MEEKQRELEALLAQEESNLTMMGKERLDELKRELCDYKEYE